jgi:hypothetical protein
LRWKISPVAEPSLRLLARPSSDSVTKIWLPSAAFIAALLNLTATGQTPSPSPRLAPYKERLAAAKSVKVETSLLGIDLGSSLEAARVRLDPLCDPTKPVLEAESEAGEDEHKAVWRLAKTDFASVYLKTDNKKRITYIEGTLRGGKEIPFDKIGQVEKAPIHSDTLVAWDVVRPGRRLLRVVARGTKRKANSITIFVVKRPTIGRSE